jgi:hypothetical protein
MAHGCRITETSKRTRFRSKSAVIRQLYHRRAGLDRRPLGVHGFRPLPLWQSSFSAEPHRALGARQADVLEHPIAHEHQLPVSRRMRISFAIARTACRDGAEPGWERPGDRRRTARCRSSRVRFVSERFARYRRFHSIDCRRSCRTVALVRDLTLYAQLFAAERADRLLAKADLERIATPGGGLAGTYSTTSLAARQRIRPDVSKSGWDARHAIGRARHQ